MYLLTYGLVRGGASPDQRVRNNLKIGDRHGSASRR